MDSRNFGYSRAFSERLPYTSSAVGGGVAGQGGRPRRPPLRVSGSAIESCPSLQGKALGERAAPTIANRFGALQPPFPAPSRGGILPLRESRWRNGARHSKLASGRWGRG